VNLVWSIAGTLAVAWILYRFPGSWLSRHWPAASAIRWLPRLLTACAVFLVPWIGVLMAQLHGQAGKRSFASSWIGLDIMEICALLLTAVLLRRRAPAGLDLGLGLTDVARLGHGRSTAGHRGG
jgi:hypothetical protein